MRVLNVEKITGSGPVDRWPAFINATVESIPGTEEKIAFDKFHLAKYLGEAVDKMRFKALRGSTLKTARAWVGDQRTGDVNLAPSY